MGNVLSRFCRPAPTEHQIGDSARESDHAQENIRHLPIKYLEENTEDEDQDQENRHAPCGQNSESSEDDTTDEDIRQLGRHSPITYFEENMEAVDQDQEQVRQAPTEHKIDEGAQQSVHEQDSIRQAPTEHKIDEGAQQSVHEQDSIRHVPCGPTSASSEDDTIDEDIKEFGKHSPITLHDENTEVNVKALQEEIEQVRDMNFFLVEENKNLVDQVNALKNIIKTLQSQDTRHVPCGRTSESSEYYTTDEDIKQFGRQSPIQYLEENTEDADQNQEKRRQAPTEQKIDEGAQESVHEQDSIRHAPWGQTSESSEYDTTDEDINQFGRHAPMEHSVENKEDDNTDDGNTLQETNLEKTNKRNEEMMIECQSSHSGETSPRYPLRSKRRKLD